MGWRAVQCRQCGGRLVARVGQPLTRCTCCGSEALVDSPRQPRVPERYRPFLLSEPQAHEAFRAYHRSDVCHHGAVAKGPDAVEALLVPTLRFTAMLTTWWYTTRPTTEGRARFAVTSGRDRAEVSVNLPASATLDAETFLALGTFDASQPEPLHEASALDIPFEAGQLHGKRGEARHALRRRHLAHLAEAHPEAQDVVGSSALGPLTVEEELAPVYLAPYTFSGRRFRVVINGVTGVCTGNLPLHIIGFGMGRYGTPYG